MQTVASSESTGEPKCGFEGLGDTNMGLPQRRRELGIPKDSPEALKDCSTRPTFTTCKDRQVRGYPASAGLCRTALSP